MWKKRWRRFDRSFLDTHHRCTPRYRRASRDLDRGFLDRRRGHRIHRPGVGGSREDWARRRAAQRVALLLAQLGRLRMVRGRGIPAVEFTERTSGSG
jgi:hypothetical protein